MNPFWIFGPLLFVWALVLAFALGLRSEGFPRDDKQMRTVIAVSIVLAFCAITSAVLAGIEGWGQTKGLRHGPEKAKKFSTE
jgi:hypothetical protein